jgi:hypothetical protein
MAEKNKTRNMLSSLRWLMADIIRNKMSIWLISKINNRYNTKLKFRDVKFILFV